MSKKLHKKHYKKIALALSLCALILWGLLGTGMSLAWFADTSPEIHNIFHFADFEVSVSYRLPDGSYAPIDGQTTVFDPGAKFEPGYAQVVYLKIKNTGDCAFMMDTAVTVSDYTPAVNVFGQTFNLQNYLKFGAVSAGTEAELKNLVANRALAKAAATEDLGVYTSEPVRMDENQEIYMALIVYMPEETSNVANFREGTAPQVELGVVVKAEQIRN